MDDQEYYAHPRNAFWYIIEELFGIPASDAYAERIEAIKTQDIALWDVLQHCDRTGSLDSNIDDDSIIPNDFDHFLNTHPDISHVFFNGGKAEKEFTKRVLPNLIEEHQALTYQRLPSTSPAMEASS